MIHTEAIKIEDEYYYTVKQFAVLTNRTEQSVRTLILKGNKLRKLKCIKFAGKPFIPAAEFTAFPFTVAGRNQTPYYYNLKGEVVNA